MVRPRTPERKRVRPVEPTGQRRVNERPLFEFETMAEQLRKQVQETVARDGFVLGIKEPKYASKWPGIAKNVANVDQKPWKRVLANEWPPMHHPELCLQNLDISRRVRATIVL